MALYEVQVNEWNRTRDYFVALVAAAQYTGEDAPSATELLADKYRSKQDVNFTSDPNIDGAVWEGSFPEGDKDGED